MYSHGQQSIHSSPIVVLAEERKCLCLCDMPEFGWRWRHSHRMTRQEAQHEPTKNRSSKFYSSFNRNMKLVMRAINTLRPTHTQGGQNKNKKTCPFCIPRPFFVFLWDACVDLLVRMLTSTYLPKHSCVAGKCSRVLSKMRVSVYVTQISGQWSV